MARPSNQELWLALVAVVSITILYAFITWWYGSIPGAADFFGHALGILGFLLMLMTETLYTLRKRTRQARWGRMADWLRFHIFTGLVGPYLVLLHTSWKFNGAAGLLSLLTVVVVISGFLGRYIYTAVPRTMDGIAVEARVLENAIASNEAALQQIFLTAGPGVGGSDLPRLRTVDMVAISEGNYRLIFGRGFDDVADRVRWWFQRRRLDPSVLPIAEELVAMQRQHTVLQRQVASLALSRSLLSIWHSVHIPIGLALFGLAFIHIVAAFYYATLLH